jgi:hypothetical protein
MSAILLSRLAGRQATDLDLADQRKGDAAGFADACFQFRSSLPKT